MTFNCNTFPFYRWRHIGIMHVKSQMEDNRYQLDTTSIKTGKHLTFLSQFSSLECPVLEMNHLIPTFRLMLHSKNNSYLVSLLSVCHHSDTYPGEPYPLQVVAISLRNLKWFLILLETGSWTLCLRHIRQTLYQRGTTPAQDESF